ncbi:hypothetical protein [Deinococcus cellulosilyticus]|uniref:Uncharacterized protein n=1 Tax=Deinococcus cellulosilyticus (strain DSM 18568 / NBRC 106333 / KACC 11606 / 5516J-15) TaxID=1223518 RepID=A0A511N8B2_DEIC1|nr:hypothetical protein [Deinococcus cellulosilyticus]GEM48671.1 hypothetical protein DC3_43060 [Deinococcus cellulosilyticus NBRC 106333 = KACC 11606]
MTPSEIEEIHQAHQSNNPVLQKKVAQLLKNKVASDLKKGTVKQLDLGVVALGVASNVLKDPESQTVLTVMQSALKAARTQVQDKNVQDVMVIQGALLDGFQEKDLQTIKKTLGKMITRLASTSKGGEAVKYLQLLLNAATTQNTFKAALFAFIKSFIKAQNPKEVVLNRGIGMLLDFVAKEIK